MPQPELASCVNSPLQPPEALTPVCPGKTIETGSEIAVFVSVTVTVSPSFTQRTGPGIWNDPESGAKPHMKIPLPSGVVTWPVAVFSETEARRCRRCRWPVPRAARTPSPRRRRRWRRRAVATPRRIQALRPIDDIRACAFSSWLLARVPRVHVGERRPRDIRRGELRVRLVRVGLGTERAVVDPDLGDLPAESRVTVVDQSVSAPIPQPVAVVRPVPVGREGRARVEGGCREEGVSCLPGPM